MIVPKQPSNSAGNRISGTGLIKFYTNVSMPTTNHWFEVFIPPHDNIKFMSPTRIATSY